MTLFEPGIMTLRTLEGAFATQHYGRWMLFIEVWMKCSNLKESHNAFIIGTFHAEWLLRKSRMPRRCVRRIWRKWPKPDRNTISNFNGHFRNGGRHLGCAEKKFPYVQNNTRSMTLVDVVILAQATKSKSELFKLTLISRRVCLIGRQLVSYI